MSETVKIQIEVEEWYPVFEASEHADPWETAYELPKADFEDYLRAEADYNKWQKRLQQMTKGDRDKDA